MTDEIATYSTDDQVKSSSGGSGAFPWNQSKTSILPPPPSVTQNSQENGRTTTALKRAFDLCGAVIGTFLLFPLLLAISVAIKLTSKGPVLFRQQRYGLNGAPFWVLKFRTMHTHLCDQSGVDQTIPNDPRVTWIGGFLRKSNFDELPQLINVLKGEMSLVGPRPHVPGMLAAGIPYEEFDQRYMDRHKVKPGITGLAQVNGFRGETRDEYAARTRLEMDLAYIETRSLKLDIKIIFKTVIREFFTGNGY